MTRPPAESPHGTPCNRLTGRALCSAVLGVLLLASCTANPGPTPTSSVAGTTAGGTILSPPATTTGPISPTGPPLPGRPPNVLIIVTDDQRFDTLDVMPKTREEFVQGGALFANGVAATPLCCPSRATIMTGRFPHNTGVLGNGDAELLEQDTTLQRYLHDAGYQTGVIGKFLNDWPLEQSPTYFDHVAVVDRGYLNRTWNLDGNLREVPDYTTTFIGDRAVEDLRAFAEHPEQPWFLYVATPAPHDPWVPAPEYADSPVPPFLRDPAMRERDLRDKPDWVADPGRVFDHPSQETVEGNRAQQLRTLRSVDDMVGRVFAELRRLRQSDDTLAFFLSDNGFLWGEHGLAGNRSESELGAVGVTGKRYPYLPSVRVPFAVRWPGHVPAGTRADRLASTVDIAPTALRAAGVTATGDPPMDGSSLLLPGNSGIWPGADEVYLEYFEDPLYPAVPSWSSILGNDVHYVRWFDDGGDTIAREYYDLVHDPFELDNLLGDRDTANDPDTSALDARIDHDRKCSGTTGDRACG